MRKALLIGIDKYDKAPLYCCVKDVNDLNNVISYNYDSSLNFFVKQITDEEATRKNVRSKIKQLFEGEGEVALFYFSGHGIDDSNDGLIVTIDYEEDDYGIRMTEILEYANKSRYKYKIIILDCCHSGYFGSPGIIGDKSYLGDGVVIMTASKRDQVSFEVNGHGVFTNLLIDSLNGGAADILGRVTPGSIYSYIDQALGAWQQRPLFKANISSFVSLKLCCPSIDLNSLKMCLKLFSNDNEIYALNPSYEKTNYPNSPHDHYEPYSVEENVKIFTNLQKLNRIGLVVPVGSEDMYFAAMKSKGCALTSLGKHYWKMANEHIL